MSRAASSASQGTHTAGTSPIQSRPRSGRAATVAELRFTPLMGAGSAEYHLAPDFCSPTETALALCRLVVSKVTTRYPNVPIVAAAMGGALPSSPTASTTASASPTRNSTRSSAGSCPSCGGSGTTPA